MMQILIILLTYAELCVQNAEYPLSESKRYELFVALAISWARAKANVSWSTNLIFTLRVTKPFIYEIALKKKKNAEYLERRPIDFVIILMNTR